MGDEHDYLTDEVHLALELAEELRRENDPAALDDAIELEIACSFWGRVLPDAMASLRRIRRYAVQAPLGVGSALARLLSRSFHRAMGVRDHVATAAQQSGTPIAVSLAVRPSGVVAAASLLVAPVALVGVASGWHATHHLAPPLSTVAHGRVSLAGTAPMLIGANGHSRSDAARLLDGVKVRASSIRPRESAHRHASSESGVLRGTAAADSLAWAATSDGGTGAVRAGPATGQPGAGSLPQASSRPTAIAPILKVRSTGTIARSATPSASATTLAQTGPTSATTTTSRSSSFSGGLIVSGGRGTVEFIELSGSPSLRVASLGAIKTSGTLAAGGYRVQGVDRDAAGRGGTWSYTLTVSAVPLEQRGQVADAVLMHSVNTYINHLEVSGGVGAITFRELSGTPSLRVSSAGAVTTSGTLAAGVYHASGSEADRYGDRGSWSYTLAVNGASAGPLAQSSATSAATSTRTSPSFGARLAVKGARGAVEFVERSGTPFLKVSPAGAVTTSGFLAAGVYHASGIDADRDGDRGTWSYALTVKAVSLAQQGRPADAVPVRDTGPYQEQLATSGGVGEVTFNQLSGTPILRVSSAGAVTTSGTLAVGVYDAGGSDADRYGDQGTWSFALTVGAVSLAQQGRMADAVPVRITGSYAEQLEVSGGVGDFAFHQWSGAPALVASASGLVTTSGTLAVGVYHAGGSDADRYGDRGRWSYTLTVNESPLEQGGHVSDAVLVRNTSSFTDQLGVSTDGEALFHQSSGTPALVASASGLVTSSGTLAVGVYHASGTDADRYGDSGTWGYTLTVVAGSLPQTSLLGAPTTTSGSSSFTASLAVSGSHGAVVFVEQSGAPFLKVTSAGTITTSGALGSGSYQASGTDGDRFGDRGIWSYTLTVNTVPLELASPTSGTTTESSSSSFSASLAVSASHGVVVFVEQSAAAFLKVTSAGTITTSGSLAPGAYRVEGVDHDAAGDYGTWSYTLTVDASS